MFLKSNKIFTVEGKLKLLSNDQGSCLFHGLNSGIFVEDFVIYVYCDCPTNGSSLENLGSFFVKV